LEKDFSNTHPETVKYFSDKNIVEKSFFAVEHLVEYVE
jgi:hypothetical protein